MITRSLAIAAALSLAFSAVAQAGNLENPSYPLSHAEQIYADLYKLSPQQRHDKLVEGAKKEDGLEFIQTLSGALGRGASKIFTDAYPFVKLHDVFLDTNLGMERLVSEERAGKHITDVGSGDLTEAAVPLEMGILARYPTPATDKMLPQFKGLLDKHNRWIVYSWNEQGISYNTRMLKEADAPKDWFDLCKPQFKGEIGIEQRGRFLIFMHMMMGEEKLKEWLTCFGKNDPIIMRGATVRLELMLAGDHSVEGANSFYRGMEYIRSKGADKVPFKPVYSTPIMAQPSGCFINRMTPRPHTAALYCDMQLSDATQKYLFDQFRNPVTMPSPFMPTEAQLITVGPMPVDFVSKLHGYWQASVGTKK